VKQRASVTLLAGWLFADVLLLLTLVALGSESEPPPSVVAVAATRAPTPAPDPSPSQTLTPALSSAAPTPAVSPVALPTPPAPPGVEQHPVIVRLAVPPGGLSDSQISTAFAEQLRTHRRAAFVLTFGTTQAPGAGVQLATSVNGALLRAAPDLFHGSAQRDFWHAVDTESPHVGVVIIETYLFTN
jgi:hypothetical protein